MESLYFSFDVLVFTLLWSFFLLCWWNSLWQQEWTVGGNELLLNNRLPDIWHNCSVAEGPFAVPALDGSLTFKITQFGSTSL